MKILFITNIPSPYRIDFFNELNKYCDLTVLFERETASDRNESWYSNKFEFNGIFLKSKKIRNESSFSLDVLKYISKDYDQIILGGYSTLTSMIASTYLKIKKIPYILNADGGFVSQNENNIKKSIKSHFISAASYWLSTGEETKKYLIHYGAVEDKVFNYHFSSIKNKDILSSPVSVFKKQKLRNELGIKYDNVVLSIGQFIPRKGFDWLIESYKDLNKNIGIYIIGGKPTHEYLNLRQTYKMDNLHFIDFQNKECLIKWYQASDVFVLPTREDIWGLVVNEAISQGLPVITTDKCIAGLELIEEGKNGYVIKNFDSKQLVKKTEEILNMIIDEYNHICQNNLEKSKEYTIEQMAIRHLEILKEIERKECL